VRSTIAVLALVLSSSIGCSREAFEGPLQLLERPARTARLPVGGSIDAGGETRAVLLASARWDVPLPDRGLLTFGLAVDFAAEGEIPGWYHASATLDGEPIWSARLNPRAMRGFRDISVEIKGGGSATLGLDISLRDKWGRPIDQPRELLLGIAEPTLHDARDYARSRGVILISIDTLRRDHVGLYGYERPTTPHLDELGAGGLVCDDAVSVSSWTLPAHLSLLTSTEPAVHGGVDMHHGFGGGPATLAESLRDAGFATRAITSHLYVSKVYGLDAGFDRLDFRQDRKADEVVNLAMDALDRIGDAPYFLFLHFYDPHWHYSPPPEVLALFEDAYAGELTGLWQDFSRRRPEDVSPDDLAHLLALYDGEIRFTDEQIGRLLEHLTLRGLDEGALIVVTSDHGEEFLEHGAWEHQRTLYEEVIRIPLLLNGADVPQARLAAQTSILDVMPTILDWLDVAPPPTARGQSLLGPLESREAYGETNHTADGTRRLFLRGGAGRWKTILSLDASGDSVQREEWFDLAADPGERASAQPPARHADPIRERAIERWRGDRESGSTAPRVELSEEQRERLRALGYVGR